MKLDAWLRQDHSLEESLHVIERLCQAVNEVHDRGKAVGALEPNRVEVGSDGHCDLSAAGQGPPSPGYAAPDAESDAPTAADDVYAVGMITWEILVGRPAGESPRHLAEVRPDLPRDLADATTACLERSADWRPKDLTYLAQMAATRQKGSGRTPDTRRARTGRQAPGRTRSRQQSRRTWPLLAALVVVLGLAALAWKQFGGPGRVPGTAQPPPSTPAAAVPTSAAAIPPDGAMPATPTPPPATDTPTAVPPTEATTGGERAETAESDTAVPVSPPAEPGPASASRAEPVATPEPVTPSAPAAPPPTTRPPARPAAPPQPVAVAPQAPAPVTPDAGQSPSADSGAQATPAVPALPLEPAFLTVVSPLEVKRPGKVLLDLRGQGFQPQHRAQIVPVKKAPQGITIVRQKRVSDTLITVLVELSEAADPGDYGIAVEDGRGGRTQAVVFKVTK